MPRTRRAVNVCLFRLYSDLSQCRNANVALPACGDVGRCVFIDHTWNIKIKVECPVYTRMSNDLCAVSCDTFLIPIRTGIPHTAALHDLNPVASTPWGTQGGRVRLSTAVVALTSRVCGVLR